MSHCGRERESAAKKRERVNRNLKSSYIILVGPGMAREGVLPHRAASHRGHFARSLAMVFFLFKELQQFPSNLLCVHGPENRKLYRNPTADATENSSILM